MLISLIFFFVWLYKETTEEDDEVEVCSSCVEQGKFIAGFSFLTFTLETSVVLPKKVSVSCLQDRVSSSKECFSTSSGLRELRLGRSLLRSLHELRNRPDHTWRYDIVFRWWSFVSATLRRHVRVHGIRLGRDNIFHGRFFRSRRLLPIEI